MVFLVLDKTGRYWAASPVTAREVDLWRLAGRPSQNDFPTFRTPFWGVRKVLKRLGYTRVNRVAEPLNPDHLRYLAEL